MDQPAQAHRWVARWAKRPGTRRPGRSRWPEESFQGKLVVPVSEDCDPPPEAIEVVALALLARKTDEMLAVQLHQASDGLSDLSRARPILLGRVM